ncbi:MAG: flagellar motor switch protein FliN, partial [Methylococcales bacterium]|nr:flagellar motor switch protein FliN [Methylococcales bacterium]
KIRDILQLSEGSIVELDRIAGESIDVLVNNTAVARAEVVVVNERYGIRLTQVLDAADRLRKL